MIDLKLRYVTVRRDRKGGERWYHQRPGCSLTRLPNDVAARFAMATRLNDAADKKAKPDVVSFGRGSIGWMIQKYRDSDEYRRLSFNSLKGYKRFMQDIEQLGSDLPFASFTRRAVVDFIESYPKNSQRRTAGTVLKNLFKLARYHGIVATDEAASLRLRTDRPRDRVWTDGEKYQWLETAVGEPYMVTAFRLLEFTAQRPVDVLKMTWPQLSGDVIRLRQQKTRALLDIPLHPILRHHLAGLERTSMMIVSDRGRPVSYLKFNRHFRAICKKTGIDAEARDLRRTAMINMALAGATTPMIASVSGHSIDRCSRILETYLPRGRELAQAAITKLSEHRK